MDIYETEEQQVEAIKKFWQEYGNQIIAGIVIGLGGLYGFNYYKNAQKEAEAEAAQAFATAEQAEQLQAFRQNYADSAYSGLAELKLAKLQVEAGELTKAADTLALVIANQNAPAGAVEMAKVRLARIQLELGETEQAISALKGDWSKPLSLEVNTILGDAYVKQGDLAAARNAYQQALMTAQPGANTSAVQMRLDDVAEPAPELPVAGE